MLETRFTPTPEILIPVNGVPTWRAARWETDLCVGYPRRLLGAEATLRPVLVEGERLLETELGPVGIISLNP